VALRYIRHPVHPRTIFSRHGFEVVALEQNADGFPAYTRHKFSFDRLRCKFEQTGDLRRA
jgi:hypothetical protein